MRGMHARFGHSARLGTAVLATVLFIPLIGTSPAHATGPCDAPIVNPIVCENSKPGVPPNAWSVQGAGDPGLQGFGTQISVNRGQIIDFKVTAVSAWHFDVLRLGWYQGNGARLIASGLTPSAPQPQDQPPCLTDTDTGLVDCGNWGVSASWQVPADAVSGVYIALLSRDDTGGQSHIVFVVRDDSSHSKMVVQTSDTTWEAYNTFGGFSLYQGPNAQHRAYKVSYNRPFITVSNDPRNWWTNVELPMWQYLERNGYDVSYISGVDTDRSGALLMNHQIFVSSGHDEYWSGPQRANVEAARDAGVNLAFFSGNTMYWKTRYEPSTDGSNAPYRTLVSYKESFANAVIDPASPTWTGLWRDTRFSPPEDGGRPENSVLGQSSTVICCQDTMQVTAADAKLRLWRNTALATMAPDTTYSLTNGSLGYEFDTDVDNGAQPPGLIRESTTTTTQQSVIKDFSENTGPATVTHHLTEYRAPSGALVFDAGTINWAYTLMGNPTGDPPDPNAQQATVNVFADMGVQPGTPDDTLAPAIASTDTTAPTSTITTPLNNTTLAQGSVVTVAGTAADIGGGVVGGVEVSTDGGTTWHPATGRSQWTYTWTVAGNGPVTVRTRAVDDSGNLESPASGVHVTVNCPCRLFPTATPSTPAANDSQAVEVGTRFHADADGYISGVRFYKGTTNTGVHIGNLWTTTGTLLATATFANETASGWQQVNFSAPVAVTANTDYIVSYHTNTGHYADDPRYYFTSADTAPLHAPASSATSPNGVYTYGTASAFPTSTNGAQNYWVDVVFTTDASPPTVLSANPASGASAIAPSAVVGATFTKPVQGSSVSLVLKDPNNATVPGTLTFNSGTSTATLTPFSALNPLTTYTATVSGVLDTSGNAMPSPYSWSFTTTSFAVCPCTVFAPSSTPATAATTDAHSVEIGLKFRADANGYVTGVRFYKGSTNTGVHTGTLWSSTGQQLATATFSNESASGWQQANFSSWVPVTANTVYVVSYHAPVGRYSLTPNALTSGVDNAPMHALANGVSGPNAVYAYATATTFPTTAGGNANYWVDAVYALSNAAPAVTTSTPAAGATAVSTSTAVTATFGKAIVGSSLRIALTDASGAAVPASSSFDGTTNTVKLTPTSILNESATYTVTVNGATDSAGVPMAAPYSYSFTTGTSPTCLCTIFTPAATPAVAAAGDAKAVELGVKFKVDRGGYVTGIRFYKGSTNTGVHIGSLWSSTGTLLARATFAGESASGWQQVNFSPHVLVSAGVTYVASYHTNAGRYSYTANGLVSAVDTPPIHAPATGGPDGANGVYQYGAASVFPTTTGNGTNYYVDAVFDTAPMVIARSPFPGTTNVATSSTVTARFSEPVAPASIAFSLVDDANSNIPGTTSYNAATQTATFTPAAPLSATTTYTATLAGATDAAGGVMTAPYTWSFSTVVLPPTVTATTPASGSTAASLGAPISATFGQSVAAASIQFSLTQNGQSVPGALSYDAPAHVMRFQPSAPLDQLQSFTATVSGATNAFGNSMSAPYAWTFTTPQAPPSVVFADPSGDNAAQVDFNVTPSVTFSQAVVPASVQMAVVDQDGQVVAGTQTFDASANKATFTPSALFNPATKFTVTVSGATNYGGVAMAAPFTFSFTTAAPQVELVARTPGVNGTDVALGAGVTATFSQPVVPASVSLAVRNRAGNSVPGTLTFLDASTKARFAPNAPLAAGTVYTVTVSGAATADGQKMPVPVSWSFTTTLPPTLSSKTPAPDATSVPLDSSVSASFDRAVAAGSTSFSLVDALGQTVPGNVTLNADGTVAAFGPTAPLASETTYTVTVSGATSLGGAVMTAPVSWSFTTASRPTVTSVTPPANATGVSVTTTVTAGFNQAVTNATVAVTDPAGALVAGTTAYNASTNTASFTPSAPLNAATPYTVTVTGATGSTGSTMLPYTSSFTTLSYGCPCTLMAPTATPATAAASDAKAVELGVKFKADVNGYISGVRFFKGATNTGVHVGTLWTATGTKLATVIFGGESASGWQQATFSSPVPVSAGTIYVASYHTNVGRYSYTTGVFANGGALDNGPLHAPTASNGVFLYGANSVFPSSPSTTGVNYFVDAIFTTS
jgi:hypothetical protein